MEASPIERGASAANLISDAVVAMGGEGWLYFWNIADLRWHTVA